MVRLASEGAYMTKEDEDGTSIASHNCKKLPHRISTFTIHHRENSTCLLSLRLKNLLLKQVIHRVSDHLGKVGVVVVIHLRVVRLAQRLLSQERVDRGDIRVEELHDPQQELRVGSRCRRKSQRRIVVTNGGCQIHGSSFDTIAQMAMPIRALVVHDGVICLNSRPLD